MNDTIGKLVLVLLSSGLAIAGDPLGGVESGKYWFEHGEKEGPYHLAGRLILSPGDRAGYAVAEADGTLSEMGLDVPDDAAELHMDFFTGKSGHGWVTTHYFLPEVTFGHFKI